MVISLMGNDKQQRDNAPRLRIGYLSTMYHSSILIKGLRLLEKEGIEPSWYLYGTGPAIVDALSQGKLDLGYIGLAPTAIGIGRGVKIKCIAGGHVEGTVIAGRKEYLRIDSFSGDMGKTLAQFKGKKVGTPRRGSLHDVFLRYYLSQFGLDKNVDIVNYDWADSIPDAMSEGELEAAVGTPPLAVLLSRLVGANIIVPPDRIWPNNPSYGIVTSDAMLENSREPLKKFLAIHKNACCSLIRNEQRKVASIVSKTVGLVDEQFVVDTLNVSPKYCASLPTDYVDSTMKLTEVLRELGYLSKQIGESDIFDFSLIREIHPEASHYSVT
jgi:NitT/TauT family transport system substrate-binding protein